MMHHQLSRFLSGRSTCLGTKLRSIISGGNPPAPSVCGGDATWSSITLATPKNQHCLHFSTRSVGGNYGDHDDDDDDDHHKLGLYPKMALVVGSSGSLGRILAKYLSKNLKMKVVGADVIPPREEDESFLQGFVTMPLPQDDSMPTSLPDSTMALVDGLSQIFDNDPNLDLDAIICVAGGWQGDPPLPPSNADDLDRLEGARQYAMTIETMMSKNLYPILAAGYAAHHFMTDDNGLFVGIGATAALGATPGMLGYGLSKTATHHFIQTMGEMTGKAVTTKSKRKMVRRLRREVTNGGGDSSYLTSMSFIGILPTTIDTPMNREAMPEADFSQWTKSIDIAKEIGIWIEEPALRPHSGSLVKVFSNANGAGATFQLVR
jgi:dihydropteridine reductase